MTPEQMMGLGALGAFAGAMMIVVVIILVAAYVYFALVLSTIAKKLKYDKGWLAWIPIVQFVLFPILAKGKQKEWPWVFILLVPIVGMVFAYIWSWKIFEKRKYPGWLCLISLLGFIPFVGPLAGIANVIIWGLVAWVDRK